MRANSFSCTHVVGLAAPQRQVTVTLVMLRVRHPELACWRTRVSKIASKCPQLQRTRS